MPNQHWHTVEREPGVKGGENWGCQCFGLCVCFHKFVFQKFLYIYDDNS